MIKPKLLALAGAIAMSLSVDAASAADAERGKAVFDIWCSGCHEPLPGRSFVPPAGTYVLEQRYQGSKPSALEQRHDLTAAYIRAMVRNGRNMMPQTRRTEVSDKDLDDLIAFLTASSSR